MKVTANINMLVSVQHLSASNIISQADCCIKVEQVMILFKILNIHPTGSAVKQN
jgi:hypothetical protein